MLRKHLIIGVDWYGPYVGLETAHKEAADEFTSGLYVCLGTRKNETENTIQYIGIAKRNLASRLKKDHHKLKCVTGKKIFWLGEIATAEPSGKRSKITPRTLDYSEWLHARFMRLPLNSMKTKSLPPESVTVLNKWWTWKGDDWLPRRRPHVDWRDLIDYPGYQLPARMVWFGGKQIQFKSPDYSDPRRLVSS